MLHLVALFAGIPLLLVMLPLLFFVVSQRAHIWPALAAVGVFGGFAIFLTALAFLRPKAPLSAIPQSANGPGHNPWPKRVFLLIVGLVVVPLMLVVVGLVVPILAQRSPPAFAASAEVRRANQSRLDELHEAIIGAARERLDETKQRVKNGTAPASEQAATERDLAIAEARDDEMKIATAQVAYAEVRLAMMKEQAQAGTVSATEVLEAEQALNTARLQLEQARRKSDAARDPNLELPAAR